MPLGTRLTDDFIAEFLDNVKWYENHKREVAQEQQQRENPGPTASEFSVRVEAEIAKGLTEVEALHAVASERPELYDAYRNASFINGEIWYGSMQPTSRYVSADLWAD
jgi:hypothetical protein